MERKAARTYSRDRELFKEYEEYVKMKEAFSVEEAGFEKEDEGEELLKDFANYIRDNKVVVLEDLANHFKLKNSKQLIESQICRRIALSLV